MELLYEWASKACSVATQIQEIVEGAVGKDAAGWCCRKMFCWEGVGLNCTYLQERVSFSVPSLCRKALKTLDLPKHTSILTFQGWFTDETKLGQLHHPFTFPCTWLGSSLGDLRICCFASNDGSLWDCFHCTARWNFMKITTQLVPCFSGSPALQICTLLAYRKSMWRQLLLQSIVNQAIWRLCLFVYKAILLTLKTTNCPLNLVWESV